jgi:CitMHS family citrate-Mg2+:H+ or citrate-Ca2+:H+ symporter
VLVLLGFAMIAVFMVLIMTKKLTPVLALIIVPTVFGLFAGAGLGIGDMVMDSMKSMTSTAALLMFAIIYFGLMIDVGLFDPLVRFILRKLGNDPAKVVLGTALLAAAVSLDGDGSTTFILTTAAMLPIYLRLKMSPVVLTCVAGLANGTMNIVPWGGPTARAASALKIDVNDVFVPMIPSLIAGLAVVLVFAWVLGLQERNRLRATQPEIWGTPSTAEQFTAGGFDGGAPAAVAAPAAVVRPVPVVGLHLSRQRQAPPSAVPLKDRRSLSWNAPRSWSTTATPPWRTPPLTLTARPCAPSCSGSTWLSLSPSWACSSPTSCPCRTSSWWARPSPCW